MDNESLRVAAEKAAEKIAAHVKAEHALQLYADDMATFTKIILDSLAVAGPESLLGKYKDEPLWDDAMAPPPVATPQEGELMTLLESAMQMSMKLSCDCETQKSLNICDGKCVGSQIWELLQRARKLSRVFIGASKGE